MVSTLGDFNMPVNTSSLLEKIIHNHKITWTLQKKNNNLLSFFT